MEKKNQSDENPKLGGNWNKKAIPNIFVTLFLVIFAHNITTIVYKLCKLRNKMLKMLLKCKNCSVCKAGLPRTGWPLTAMLMCSYCALTRGFLFSLPRCNTKRELLTRNRIFIQKCFSISPFIAYGFPFWKKRSPPGPPPRPWETSRTSIVRYQQRSKSGSFWASQFLLASSKNSKKKSWLLLLYNFLSLKKDINVSSKK